MFREKRGKGTFIVAIFVQYHKPISLQIQRFCVLAAFLHDHLILNYKFATMNTRFPYLFLLFCFLLVQVPVSAQKKKTDPKKAIQDSISEFMFRGSLLSMGAMQSVSESQSAKAEGNLVLSRQKSGESQNYFNQSRLYYRKVLAYDSTYVPAWNNMGSSYYMQGLHAQSIYFFNKAVTLSSTYSSAWMNMGKAYDQMGKIDSAIYFIRKSIEVDSTFIQGYTELARVYQFRKNDQAAAISILKLACNQKVANETPQVMLADIYFQNGDSIHAIVVLEEAAEINPNEQERLQILISYFNFHGDAEKAKMYQKKLDASIRRSEVTKRKGE
jgi:tetratricopeptide (TPR) repeat protein